MNGCFSLMTSSVTLPKLKLVEYTNGCKIFCDELKARLLEQMVNVVMYICVIYCFDKYIFF